MAEWKKCNLNAQNILVKTDKSVLIQMPHKSAYDGFVFWHSARLVRPSGGKGYFYTFSFTDDFKFELKKYGKGQYNSREVIDSQTIGAESMIEAFKGRG